MEINFSKTDEPDYISLIETLDKLKGGDYVLTVEKKVKHRTTQQNRALHLVFRWIAEALNAAGWDMKKTLRKDIDIPWSDKLVKEYLWKPLQEAMYGTASTKKLERGQIDPIRDVLVREIGGRTGVDISAFPSAEQLMENNL